ncbi:basic salivary proline-rich protein 1-like [Vulpes lagopus]|uniref:basic salivary proline-rich protein 1-like n=1 Tax=Vulpes lagopus TaxID=494514 RepID=UPI001BC94B9F|nr:basic salivary proline-rich protein 1-like [Vulpes lagopus]
MNRTRDPAPRAPRRRYGPTPPGGDVTPASCSLAQEAPGLTPDSISTSAAGPPTPGALHKSAAGPLPIPGIPPQPHLQADWSLPPTPVQAAAAPQGPKTPSRHTRSAQTTTPVEENWSQKEAPVCTHPGKPACPPGPPPGALGKYLPPHQGSRRLPAPQPAPQPGGQAAVSLTKYKRASTRSPGDRAGRAEGHARAAPRAPPGPRQGHAAEGQAAAEQLTQRKPELWPGTPTALSQSGRPPEDTSGGPPPARGIRAYTWLSSLSPANLPSRPTD